MACKLARSDSGIAHTQKTFKDTDSASMPQCRVLRDIVSEQVNEYILETWQFDTVKTRQDFIQRDIGGLACSYFPLALECRITLIARLLAILSLIAGELADLDLDDGEGYLEALEAAVRGHWLPDDNVPPIFLLCTLLDEMRAQDYMLVDDIIDTSLTHLRSTLIRRGRTSRREDSRLTSKGFRIGATLLSALDLFAVGQSADWSD